MRIQNSSGKISLKISEEPMYVYVYVKYIYGFNVYSNLNFEERYIYFDQVMAEWSRCRTSVTR